MGDWRGNGWAGAGNNRPACIAVSTGS